MSEADQNLEETVKIIKNLQKTLFTWRVFVCYTTEVASHAHLLCMQKYTRSEIPADGALRCEAGSLGKRTGRKKLTKKGECRQLTAEEEKKLKDSIGRS